MIKIYCEDGAVTKPIRKIGQSEEFTLISFPFENHNRRTKDATKPSHLTADSTFFTADNTKVKLSNTSFSDKGNGIKDIIGINNFNDVRHFDTAYKEDCQIFLTPDKKDIASKANRLFTLTGIKVFHCDDIDHIREYCTDLIKKRNFPK